MRHPVKDILRIPVTFNTLLGDLVCLSHTDHCVDESGNRVALAPGLQLAAFELEVGAEGDVTELEARGVVEPSPEGLMCHGSRWALRLDRHGVQARRRSPANGEPTEA